MSNEETRFFQIDTGGLAVAKKEKCPFTTLKRGYNHEIDGYIFSYTTDFQNWKETEPVQERVPHWFQKPAKPKKEAEETVTFNLIRLQSIEEYIMWTAIGKDGKNYLSAFPFDSTYSSINRIKLSYLDDVYEDNLFHIDEKTKAFLRFVEKNR